MRDSGGVTKAICSRSAGTLYLTTYVSKNRMENQKIIALQNIFSSRLDTLSHLLEVVESHFADDIESLLQRRIAPDMFPFGTQIAFVCNQPRNFVLWCLGQAANNLNPDVASLVEARGHISSTISTIAPQAKQKSTSLVHNPMPSKPG